MKLFFNLKILFSLIMSIFRYRRFFLSNRTWKAHSPFNVNVISDNLIYKKNFSKSKLKIKDYKEDIYPLY